MNVRNKNKERERNVDGFVETFRDPHFNTRTGIPSSLVDFLLQCGCLSRPWSSSMWKQRKGTIFWWLDIDCHGSEHGRTRTESPQNLSLCALPLFSPASSPRWRLTSRMHCWRQDALKRSDCLSDSTVMLRDSVPCEIMSFPSSYHQHHQK